MPAPVIRINGLRKFYGDLEAVRGLDLEVESGEVFAILGPNGAGKTTTVEILEGYRERSGGEVEVLGVDPSEPTPAWRERIGIVLQGTALEPFLTVRESLSLYAGYYSASRDVDEVINLVGLSEQASSRAGRLSGGQQRRLDVGIALIGDPDLLFLDEPTTGFDPSARRQAWEMIAGLRDLGKTVLLTTHYMDEAQHLADRVAIIAKGRILAEDTPENLRDSGTGPARITFRLADGARPESVPGFGPVNWTSEESGSGPLALIETTNPVEDANRLTGWALDQGLELVEFEVRRPTLEDIYLEVTRT
ncbi:MAG: ABC transporter ATP-binding protein [Thermoleophilia bacterium]|nr:ABC transporter ATP-binding protein [Thermoleophilia bacterium]